MAQATAGPSPASADLVPSGSAWRRLRARASRSSWSLALPLAGVAVLYDPNASAGAAKTVAGLGCALAFLAHGFARRARRPVLTWRTPSVLWLLFVGWMALSMLWARHGALGHLPLWTASLGLVFGLASAPDARRVARHCALATSGLCAAACLARFAAGARGLALHGQSGNPDWLGLVLACALPLVVDGAYEHVASWRKSRAGGAALPRALAVELVACGVVALASGAALVVAGARTSWLALGLAAVVFTRGWLRIALAVALVAGAAATFALTDVGAAFAGRTWIWAAGARAALAAAPLGAGVGEFPWAFLDAQGAALRALTPERAGERFANANSAHNDWIELAAEGGVLGAGLALAALLVTLFSLRRRFAAGAASVLVVMLAACGDTPLSQPGVLVLLAPIFATAGLPGAVADGAKGRAALVRGGPNPSTRGAAIPLVVGCALCFVACAIALRFALGSYLAERRLAGARVAAPSERRAHLRAAQRLDSRSGEAALELGLEALAANEHGAGLADLETARAHLADVATLVAIGNAHYARGEIEAACRAFEAALRWNPGSFRAHANLAEALRAAGDLTGAEGHLAAARNLQPFHPKIMVLAERLRLARIAAETRAPDDAPRDAPGDAPRGSVRDGLDDP